MFVLKRDDIELFDSEKNEFTTIPGEEYTFSFDLVSLDFWESKHRKRFLDNPELTTEEILDFIKIMCRDESLDVSTITQNEFDKLMKYITDTPTATVFPPRPPGSGTGRKKVFTSEIIYAHMSLAGIPYDWETKNLNKLITLINTIAELQEPPKKMSRSEAMQQQRDIILARRKEQERLNDKNRNIG